MSILPDAGEAVDSEIAREPTPLPLSEPGPYSVGVREFSAQDACRDGRKVGVRVWYPAVWPEDTTRKRVIPKADPDCSDAPYPLIVSSAKVGSIFAPYLVTHGFVWAGVTQIDTYDGWNPQLIDQPLDILFALDQVASNPPEELDGMIDAEHAGATGYSFDGTNALVLGGARIDPEFYLAQCASADATAEAILSLFPSRYQCAVANDWDEFAAHAGKAITSNDDGLWQPITDARIRAVMPLAGEGWLLFGDKGLAAVDRPTLLIVATRDELYEENALLYELLGTPDKTLISFVGARPHDGVRPGDGGPHGAFRGCIFRLSSARARGPGLVLFGRFHRPVRRPGLGGAYGRALSTDPPTDNHKKSCLSTRIARKDGIW